MIDLIYTSLKYHFSNHEHMMLNKYIFEWESDLFCASKSGYCVEVEVKVSKSDFKVDFEKQKHQLFAAAAKNQSYCVIRGSYGNIHNTTIEWNSELKIEKFLGSTIAKCTSVKFHDMKTAVIPNKFWFAAQAGLLEASEIPDYAGLLYIWPKKDSGYTQTTVVKNAPFLHKRKIHLPDLLFDKYKYGYWNLLNENQQLRDQIKIYEKRANDLL